MLGKKQKVIDLFKDINQNNKGAGFEQKSCKRFYQYRAKLVNFESVLDRLAIFQALKLLSGSLYLNAMLLKIEVAK